MKEKAKTDVVMLHECPQQSSITGHPNSNKCIVSHKRIVTVHTYKWAFVF